MHELHAIKISFSQDACLYEAAQKIKYLEMVIHESMRLYTPLKQYVHSKDHPWYGNLMQLHIL